jgi:hypothetical protein
VFLLRGYFCQSTVRDLKECLLAPKSKQYLLAPKQCADCKMQDWQDSVAESVTNFQGVISANAKFVEWTNASLACSSV